ncbi:hypothetical protein B0H13DRAFT_1891159 [Mycena leptocephala]|nr:hypothetical protein B0H13DRAFT_1891159 [Mycena leptocephala]
MYVWVPILATKVGFPLHLVLLNGRIGTPLSDIFSAPNLQKREIVNILKLLHRNRIHHHDVRAENLMVNYDGAITLVDFDRAVKVDGDECRHCPDVELMGALQECMRAPGCLGDGYGTSGYM